MREITQRILADPMRNDGHDKDGNSGDCFRCCLAMLTGSNYEETPHAVMYVSWFDVSRVYTLKTTGFDLAVFDPEKIIGNDDVIGIGTGKSPRGDFQHCVMISTATGETIFDPHPSRAGIIGLSDVIILYPPELMLDWPILFPVLSAI